MDSCVWSSIPWVGGFPGQRTSTSGLWRCLKTSTSWAFQASSSVCINSMFRSSIVICSAFHTYPTYDRNVTISTLLSQGTPILVNAHPVSFEGQLVLLLGLGCK